MTSDTVDPFQPSPTMSFPVTLRRKVWVLKYNFCCLWARFQNSSSISSRLLTNFFEWGRLCRSRLRHCRRVRPESLPNWVCRCPVSVTISGRPSSTTRQYSSLEGLDWGPMKDPLFSPWSLSSLLPSTLHSVSRFHPRIRPLPRITRMSTFGSPCY